MTATDDHVKALVERGRAIGKVPWSWDEAARSAAAAVLRLCGVTEQETEAEARERIQQIVRGQG